MKMFLESQYLPFLFVIVVLEFLELYRYFF